MKQVRFTSVVEQSGKPEVYLLLSDPKKDPDFQAALKANRVMTIEHGHTGGRTSFGQAGYRPGPQAQVLVFPKALKVPDDAHVIGINFNLLDEEHEPVKEEPKPKAEPKKSSPTPKSKAVAKPEAVPKPKPICEPLTPKKVIQFAKTEPADEEEGEENEEVAEIKADIRKALNALEAGKQVAAFNILKRLVD